MGEFRVMKERLGIMLTKFRKVLNVATDQVLLLLLPHYFAISRMMLIGAVAYKRNFEKGVAKDDRARAQDHGFGYSC